MYNRYIPGTNGIYERTTVEEPSSPSSEPDTAACCAEVPAPGKPPVQTGLDLGDLLVLCIVLLLLLDAEQQDILPLLLTAAAFILFQ